MPGLIYILDSSSFWNHKWNFDFNSDPETLIWFIIVQACRGSQLDHGVVEADSDDVTDALPKGRRIPQEADVLMAFSTVPGLSRHVK